MSEYGAEYDRQKIAPRSEWRETVRLDDPATGATYVIQEIGAMRIPPMDRMNRVEDFTPPESWGDWDTNDPRWDYVFQRRFGEEYTNNKDPRVGDPRRPVPIDTQIEQMGKSYLRKKQEGTLGYWGVYCWANWTNVPHTWFVMNAENWYFLRTEQELGKYEPFTGGRLRPSPKKGATRADLKLRLKRAQERMEYGQHDALITLSNNAQSVGWKKSTIDQVLAEIEEEKRLAREENRRKNR